MSRNPDFDAVMIKKTELDTLRADIERLKAEKTYLGMTYTQAQHEVERLFDAKGRMRVDLANAQADIERLTVYYNLLRDALSWYDAHNIDHLPQWVVSARHALEPKP